MKTEKSIKDLLDFSIILIDKPSGPTSFKVSQYIMKSLGLKKTGHMGTLDPMVSGVLPITLNRACRISDYLMHSDKEYIGVMRLHVDIKKEKLKGAINSFIGKIKQTPPVRSRVKRQERIREIKLFNILEKEGKDVLFRANVQAGTYIRKLIHDLGIEIGGAHMLELRRTRASVFSEKDIIDLYKFDSILEEYNKGNEKSLRSVLIPAEEVIKMVLPEVEIKEKNLKKILNGKPLTEEDFMNSDEVNEKKVFCAFYKDRFIGIYKKVEGNEMLAKPEFVL